MCFLALPGHVVAHQEIGHTLTEQAVLKRMSREIQNPFIVHLHHSFHDKENLSVPTCSHFIGGGRRSPLPIYVCRFLVMDFHPGGDLATQLARWGKFGRDRARFYAAEIVRFQARQRRPAGIDAVLIFFIRLAIQVEGVQGLHAAGVSSVFLAFHQTEADRLALPRSSIETSSPRTSSSISPAISS